MFLMSLRVLGLGIIFNFVFSSLAPLRADLVYDQEVSAESSESPESDFVVEPQVQQPKRIEVAEPAADPTRTDILRRERMRAEVKNEDALQSRLEELRLRDEQKRTDQILAPEATASATGVEIQNQVIQAPVTAVRSQDLAQDQVYISQAAPRSDLASTQDLDRDSDSAVLGFIPRAGITSLSQASGEGRNASKYSLGVGINVGVSEYLSAEIGYAYSEFGIKTYTVDPWVNYYQYSFNQLNSNLLSYKQNLIEVGARLNPLGERSKFQPYVGAGGAYSIGYLNYDSKVKEWLRKNNLKDLTNDYSVNQFMGYLTAGADVKVGKNVGISGQFKYYNVLSSNETTVSNSSVYPYAYYAADYDKQRVGTTIAKASFYSIMLGLNFTF